MSRRDVVWLFSMVAVVVMLLTATGCASSGGGTPSQAPTPDSSALFAKHCGKCHGSQGQGDSAPAVRPSRFQRSDLFSVVADGRDGTAMKGFRGELSEGDVKAILDYLLK